MTDTTNETTKSTPEMGSDSSGSYEWSEPETTTGGMSAQAREWLGQLQSMIEQLATQAAPVARQIGAKAAELAAAAGEKAGPVAQRAADITGQAGHKLAERSRDIAADLRRDAADKSATNGAGETESTAADEPTTSGVA